MPLQLFLRSEELAAMIAFRLTGLLSFLVLSLICHVNHPLQLNCSHPSITVLIEANAGLGPGSV